MFGDQAVAAAMIDCIVHRADVLTLKGTNHRLRGRGIDGLPSTRTTTGQTESSTRDNRTRFKRRIDQSWSAVDSQHPFRSTTGWLRSP